MKLWVTLPVPGYQASEEATGSEVQGLSPAEMASGLSGRLQSRQGLECLRDCKGEPALQARGAGGVGESRPGRPQALASFIF